MKLLFSKMILFLLPFVLWACLVVMVDPYNYFNVSHLVSDSKKRDTSFKLNRFLWKTIEFRRSPSTNILLGDSRVDSIDVSYIKTITGDNYFNFAHGGGTLADIVDTFNYVKKTTNLSNVYIGVNFNLYNGYNSEKRFTASELISTDYKYYLYDRLVAKALFYNLASLFTNKAFDIGPSFADKDTFWKHQLSQSATYFYKNYKYPSNYYHDLKSIAEYCKANNVNLVFIIPPSHVDLQHRVADFNLLEAEKRFKKDLMSLGVVYDFDYPNEWTKNCDNFSDPFHFNKTIMEKVVDEVWGNNHSIAKISRNTIYLPLGN